jgi:hypothetical protein
VTKLSTSDETRDIALINVAGSASRQPFMSCRAPKASDESTAWLIGPASWDALTWVINGDLGRSGGGVHPGGSYRGHSDAPARSATVTVGSLRQSPTKRPGLSRGTVCHRR